MSQPVGSYPRLNAAMLQSGKYEQMIVSLIGKIIVNSHNDDDGVVTSMKFQCADGGVIQLATEHAEIPTLAGDAIVEIVGQAMSLNEVMVRVTVGIVVVVVAAAAAAAADSSMDRWCCFSFLGFCVPCCLDDSINDKSLLTHTLYLSLPLSLFSRIFRDIIGLCCPGNDTRYES